MIAKKVVGVGNQDIERNAPPQQRAILLWLRVELTQCLDIADRNGVRTRPSRSKRRSDNA